MNLLSRIRNSRASAASGAPAAAEAAAEATAGLQPLALPPYVQPRVGAAGPRVVVIGAGRMGQLIAGQLALRGSVAVILYDLSTFTRERALAAVRASLDELEGNGLLPRGAAEEAMTRITVSETLADILQANLVVEAVPEDLAIKRNIFLEVDKVLTREKVPTGAGPLLCSNSISLAPDSIFKIKHKL
ncbi:3-hydroxyacyl-CoA dehydrogenase [Pavlovales sp. CCMP2436]|nr:3-hydroxyacyl-CoA dehydrogenase [Pavlovales sp. CCMP2436]